MGLFVAALALDAGAQTRRVLVLRVDFPPDTLETTTGDGSFESAFRFAKPGPLDPLPHDSLYVDSHLRFLEHWYRRASAGALELEWEIWPAGPSAQAAYTLDHPMWHYHWNQSSARTDEQLAELFRDALVKADEDPGLRVFDDAGQRRFDSVIVLHAGVGQDFGEDATPHDIPSAWLGPSQDGSPAAHEGPLRDVRAVGDTLTWTVRQGLLVPESENHETFSHGLAGLLVLQFGHELGLPNLYESTTGRSVIGKWGLMDQGSANYLGLLPAPLDAWSRLWLGWGAAQTLGSARDSVQVAAPDGPASLPRLLRIPLTDDEAFLVEYRRRAEEGRDWTWARDRAGSWARLHSDFTVSYQDTLGQAGDSTGVFVEAGNLDFDLPGSGLLVWHVDQRATTAERVAANTVNDEALRRGVDLEEGDGVQDMGREYGLFSPRSSVGLGGPEDPWQQPSTGWIFANPHYAYGDVSLAWDTEPSTATNDGLFTGLRLHAFSGPVGSGAERSYPAAGRFSLDWDFRPASHGQVVCPPMDEAARLGARLQGFTWENGADSSGLALLSLLDGWGRSYGLVLDGELGLWPRADAFASPLPALWQEGLGGLQELRVDEAPALAAWRGDSLALFTPVDDGSGLRFHQHTLRVFPGLGAVLARPATREIFVATQDSILRLDHLAREVEALAHGLAPDATLQLVDVRDVSDWPALVGRTAGGVSLRFGDGTLVPLETGAEVLGLDSLPQAFIPENAVDSLLATALVRTPAGLRFYHGSRHLRTLDAPNIAVLPIQFGPDAGYEVLVRQEDGRCGVYNQDGVALADFSLGAGQAAALTASRTDGGGIALLAAAPDRLNAMDATGQMPATWPRVWAGAVDGPVALPELGQVLGLRVDGGVVAWEASLDGPVWTQPRGDANGGMRPAFGGTTHEVPVAAVRQHAAYVWPNPSTEVAHFHYVLEAPARVRITVYDTAGHEVARLEEDHPRAGEQEQAWALGSVSSGAYFALLEASGGQAWTRRVKVAVLK